MAVGGKGHLLISVQSVFYSLSFAIVCLRCYVRILLTRAFGLDDALVLAALAGFTGLVIVVTIGVHIGGIGQHFTALSLEEFATGMKYYLFGELLYVLSTCLVKLSFCFTLLRITNSRLQIWLVQAIMVVISAFSIFYFFFILFTCKPVKFFWERLLPTKAPSGGSCRNPDAMVVATYVHGIVISSSDLTLAILPIVLLWNVQMKMRVKITIGILLAMGSVASVATFARIPFIPRLKNDDFLYDNADIALWSVVEVGVSIMTISAATLRPLMKKCKLMAGFSSNGNDQYRSRSRSGYMRNENPDLPLQTIGTKNTRLGGSFYNKRDPSKASSEEHIWDAKNEAMAVSTHIDSGDDDHLAIMPGNGNSIQKMTQIQTSSHPATSSTNVYHLERVANTGRQ